MKDLRELRTEWEGLKASGFYNHTMIGGPIDKVYCYGTDQWYEAQFDEFVASKRASEHNLTMALGPVSRLRYYGAGNGMTATFDEFVKNKRAFEHYNELRASADSNCPQCHGEGYVPIGITPPYLQSCSCVFRRQTVKV